ncbi:MAG TPA: serine hydrolase [Terriglobales bacterium]|nr:serine hydrolase [Terriglobales bacterium]
MSRGLCITFVVALLAPLAASQPAAIKRLDGSTITPAGIDATVTRLMTAAEVTGIDIAILNDGKVAYMKSYGFRDKEKNLPLTPDSIMTAASLTKSTFAFMVMQLVQEKIIDLDKPVYQYLPKPLPQYAEYRDLAGDPRYKKITARMLLSHTAGFPNFRYFTDDHKLSINFEPGSRFAYSGEGILLLQLVVETVTGKPLEKLMQTRVFQPLGMTRTSMTWQPSFESDYANGYDEYGRSIGPQRRPTADAAGSMQTTLKDFTQLMLAVTDGELLQKQTRELMLSPQVQIFSKHEFPSLATETTDVNKGIRLSYGLGWGLYWTPLGRVFFKEGHTDGFRNYVACFDKQGSGIIILTNSSNGEGIFEDLLETSLKNSYTPIEWEGYTPYDKLPPRPPLVVHKEAAIDPKSLDGYLGRYVFTPGVVLMITRAEGTHLFVQEFVQGSGEPKQELAPEGDRKFFSMTTDDEYTFEVDSSGRATGMVLHTDGRDLPMKRAD